MEYAKRTMLIPYSKECRMKTVWHIPYPDLAGVERIFISIRTLLGLIRDMVKALYLAGIQLCTRLFFIERGPASAISLWARLDGC